MTPLVKQSIRGLLVLGLTTVCSLTLALPHAHAAIVSLQTPPGAVSKGDVVLIKVLVDTQGQTINTVEGDIVLRGPVKITDMTRGGSVLSIWPNPPSLQINGADQVINFLGGVPNGVVTGTGLLFTIAINAPSSGTITMEPKNIIARQNDGSGTPVQVSTQKSVLTVGAAQENPRNDWQALMSTDVTPPEPFTIAFGSDSNVANGQTFITFFTTDSGSGIDHYEVKEGEREAVRASSPYVLQNQTKREKITVAAYDKSGNSRVVTWTPDTLTLRRVLIVTGIVVSIILIVVAGWLWKKRKKQQQS